MMEKLSSLVYHKILRNCKTKWWSIKHRIRDKIKYQNENNLTSFEPRELQCYKSFYDDWWYEVGLCRWLHTLNELRIPLICNAYLNTHELIRSTITPNAQLEKFQLLDVGCGGGVLSESLAYLGFDVTGLDPNQSMIFIAEIHARENKNLRGKRLRYIHSTIEDFSKNNREKFDGIIISEVLDRVVKKDIFMEAAIRTLKPGGKIFITTKNRTVWAAMVVGISIILKDLPLACLSWNLFISPYSLKNLINKFGCRVETLRGIRYHPDDNTFAFKKKWNVWYYMQAVKISTPLPHSK